MSERRRYSRINFCGDCSISHEVQQHRVSVDATLIDISLTGALLDVPAGWQHDTDKELNLNLTLPGSDITLEINSQVCHQASQQLGIKFLSISLESITHLKRLIQLNLGDEKLLHREMSQLINPSEK